MKMNQRFSPSQLSTAALLMPGLLALTACVSVPIPEATLETDNTESLTFCQEPRPQVCTMDYRPVCAELKEGGSKTYSNGCGSCTDPKVVGYRDGACEKAK